jgi:hypothetical protein
VVLGVERLRRFEWVRYQVTPGMKLPGDGGSSVLVSFGDGGGGGMRSAGMVDKPSLGYQKVRFVAPRKRRT